MATYEYMTVTVGGPAGDDLVSARSDSKSVMDTNVQGQHMLGLLNELGAEGWQVVQQMDRPLTTIGSHQQDVLLLMREKPSV
jgi:hypothetical protein